MPLVAGAHGVIGAWKRGGPFLLALAVSFTAVSPLSAQEVIREQLNISPAEISLPSALSPAASADAVAAAAQYVAPRSGPLRILYRRVERYHHPLDSTAALQVTLQKAEGPEILRDQLLHHLPPPLEVSTGTCWEHAFYYGDGPFLFIPSFSHWEVTEYGMSKTARVFTTNVTSGSPDAKNYASFQLMAADWYGEIIRGFTRFSFDGLGATGLPVEKAFLRVAPYGYQTEEGGSNAFKVHAVADAWPQGGVTWNNQPGITGDAVPGPPGSGSALIDITDFAQSWMDGASANNGVRLSLVDGGTPRMRSFRTLNPFRGDAQFEVHFSHPDGAALSTFNAGLVEAGAQIEITYTGLTGTHWPARQQQATLFVDGKEEEGHLLLFEAGTGCLQGVTERVELFAYVSADDDFIVTAEPDTIGIGDVSPFFIFATDRDADGFAPDFLIDLELLPAASDPGVLRRTDTREEGAVLREVPYALAEEGGVVFVAQDAPPPAAAVASVRQAGPRENPVQSASIPDDAPQEVPVQVTRSDDSGRKGEGKLWVEPYRFEISLFCNEDGSEFPCSTLLNEEVARIEALPKDKNRQDFPLDAEALVVFDQSPNGIVRGRFEVHPGLTSTDTLRGRTVLVKFLDVSDGKVHYVAGGEPVRGMPEEVILFATRHPLTKRGATAGTVVLQIEPILELMLGETMYFQARPDPQRQNRLIIDALGSPEKQGGHPDVEFTLSRTEGDRMGAYRDDRQTSYITSSGEIKSQALDDGMIRLVGRFWKSDASYKVQLVARHGSAQGRLSVEITEPAGLGDTRRTLRPDVFGDVIDIDSVCIRWGGALGIPPQLLKGHMAKESIDFLPSYLYEPYTVQWWDYVDNQEPFFVTQQAMGKAGAAPVPDHKNVQFHGYETEPRTVWNMIERFSQLVDAGRSNKYGKRLTAPATRRGNKLLPGDMWFYDYETAWDIYFIIRDDYLERLSTSDIPMADQLALVREAVAFYIEHEWRGTGKHATFTGMKNAIAQTRIASSYGLLQQLYFNAVEYKYPKDVNHAPEELNVVAIQMEYAMQRFNSHLGIGLRGSGNEGQDGNWSGGYEHNFYPVIRSWNSSRTYAAKVLALVSKYSPMRK